MSKNTQCISIFLHLGVISLSLAATTSNLWAQEGSSAPKKGEKVNLNPIKEKYWARGNEAEVGVVQHRLYSKARRVELGLFGGFMGTDPFLDVTMAGATLGYHFTEYVAFNLAYWAQFVSKSSAQEAFEAQTGATVNTNHPKSFMGGELAFSPIYGKLSLMGAAIIYYDLHAIVGVGSQDTESGKSLGILGGIGQQIYLAKWASLRLDYRLVRYEEDILAKTNDTKRGIPVGGLIDRRVNLSSLTTVGITFLF